MFFFLGGLIPMGNSLELLFLSTVENIKRNSSYSAGKWGGCVYTLLANEKPLLDSNYNVENIYPSPSKSFNAFLLFYTMKYFAGKQTTAQSVLSRNMPQTLPSLIKQWQKTSTSYLGATGRSVDYHDVLTNIMYSEVPSIRYLCYLTWELYSI